TTDATRKKKNGQTEIFDLLSKIAKTVSTFPNMLLLGLKDVVVSGSISHQNSTNMVSTCQNVLYLPEPTGMFGFSGDTTNRKKTYFWCLSVLHHNDEIEDDSGYLQKVAIIMSEIQEAGK
ncbi:hypothetical protein ILUMI_14215, partial [Ignelater luminosus]